VVQIGGRRRRQGRRNNGSCHWFFARGRIGCRWRGYLLGRKRQKRGPTPYLHTKSHKWQRTATHGNAYATHYNAQTNTRQRTDRHKTMHTATHGNAYATHYNAQTNTRQCIRNTLQRTDQHTATHRPTHDNAHGNTLRRTEDYCDNTVLPCRQGRSTALPR
jgi:hypothetical protein